MDMLIGGEWRNGNERMEVHDPQDGTLVDTVPRGTAADLREAVSAAVDGFERARRMPAHERMTILREAAERVAARHEDFATTIAREGVKTIREARREVTRCIETLRISSEEARRITGETIAFDQMPGSENRVGYYARMPIGVVAAITPFNDPLNLVAHKVGPAIACGNSVVVKPHEETPLSALKLAEVFEAAGLPPRVLQVVTGPGSEVGDALVMDRRVRMISFTGSRPTGQSILRNAGMKKVGVELGSNSPVIVIDDAGIERAVACSVSGAYWAAGQNCLHVQRLFVHRAVYDDFRERFVAAASAYRVGDKMDEATDMGPLINRDAARRVEMLVEDARASGARVLCGGERRGTFFAPTLLEDVPDSCAVAREEVFGPVTCLFRIDSLEEGIARANELDYGLHAAIFTRDLKTAFRAAAELECGGVMINDSTDYRIDQMPFGGIKGSGLGREGVRFAIEEMSEPKVVCFNLRD